MADDEKKDELVQISDGSDNKKDNNKVEDKVEVKEDETKPELVQISKSDEEEEYSDTFRKALPDFDVREQKSEDSEKETMSFNSEGEVQVVEFGSSIDRRSEFEKKDEALQLNMHNRHEKMSQFIYHERPDMLPNRYVFILTNRCNLTCEWCFQEKDKREGAMTAKEWIHLASQLPDYARVTLTGGEPFLFEGFKEVFDYVASRFECNIISNGTLLTHELSDFLLQYPKFQNLSISIDNPYNTLRRPNPLVWKKTEEELKYFREKRDELGSKTKLGVKITILSDNAHDLYATYRYAKEIIKCESISFQFLKGSPVQHADVDFTWEQALKDYDAPVYENWDTIKKELELIKREVSENKERVFLHPKIDSMINEGPMNNLDSMNKQKFEPEKYQKCVYPWSSVHINVDGNLYPCLAIPMGNLKKTPLKDVIHGEKFQRFKDIIRSRGTVGSCNRCGWLKPLNPIMD